MEQSQAGSISRSIIMAAASIASGTLTTCRCLVPGGKHAPLECQRQRRARTLSPPLSRTVEQSQAGSISRSFMAAASVALGRPTCRCLLPGGNHAPPECHRQRRARTLRLPPPRTVEQPQARLDQSELHRGGFLCKGRFTCRCLLLTASNLQLWSASGRAEHAP